MDFGTGEAVTPSNQITQVVNPTCCACGSIPADIDCWDLVKCIIEFKNVADKTKEKMSSISEDNPDMALPSTEVIKATSDSLPVLVGRGRGRGSRGRRGSRGTASGSGGDRVTGKAKALNTRTQRSCSTTSEPSPFPSASTSNHTSTESLPNASSTTDLPLIEGLGKRKRSAEDTASRGSKRSLKPSLKEVQLASYGVECLSVGNRHYVTGIYIDRWMMTLWYYDRHAILRTVPSTFREEPKLLALVMFALSQCDKHRAGFSPFFYKSIPPVPAVHSATDNAALDCEAPGTGELHLEGSLSNITFSDILTLGIAAPVNDVRQPEVEEPEVETAPGESPAYTPAETLDDECFLMFPPTGTEKERVPRFRIKEVLSTYYGMVGRGTSVFSVQEVNNNDIVEDPLLALKMSWQWHFRTPEGETISELRQAIPDWADHLPDIKFYTSYQPEDLDLPWTRLDVKKPPNNTIQPRYLHAMAAKQYKCLWEAGDINKFKQAFLDCVECHYHAWKDGRVLHRDLSETNLMVYSVDNAKVKGVVNDWDMSSKLGEDGNVIRSAAIHRTGTAPFMACDLLSEVAEWPHFYRHDLESLFYILLWAAIHYDLKKGEQYRTGKAHPRFEGWVADGLDKKFAFLSNEVAMDAIFSNIGPGFESLKTEWLVPLWKLFHDAHVNKRRWNPSADANYDHATCDGRLTFETFMGAMGATPRGNSVVV
ncbi:hypothetical protein K443DRAFT_4177 [Laccaria amethystina LaAM-08-1]|uniref:Fungal-type protein kinase domain-containing protein n=1 Tax=Laccaria amethystina LaAM-08-1 TaxID=1095629 RepID=A0A0C9Y4J2_9AGAR|nr:hypothetical protein K443DRAFT_4177 [Laccaria amethystina LaAM-08-1]